MQNNTSFRNAIASLGRSVKENPASIVSHIIGGALAGGIAWGISSVVDRDVSESLRVKERPRFFSMAPELTGVFLDMQSSAVCADAPEQQEAFEEAVRQLDSLLELERDIDAGDIAATAREVADANGFVRRTVAELRKLRDAAQSPAKVAVINRHMARITELMHAHVTNIRSASMFGKSSSK